MRRSEGNPLFVEELIDAEGDGVPLLMHDLLLRHVGRLDATSTRLARLASVGGSIIDTDVLQDASGLPDDQFTLALRAILDANVIIRRADRFSFRHALLREAIHDDLLPGERVELHAALARALRSRVEAGSTAERWRYGAALALHAYAARDVPLAFDASVWAGLAGKQYGAAAAADHFERALELWDRVPDAAERSQLAKTDLPRLAARVLANEGVRARVHALLRQAVELLPVDGDPLAASRVYTEVGGEWIQVPGVLDQDVALERAISLAGPAPSRELAEALSAAAFHESRMGQFGLAVSHALRALDVCAVLGADDLVPEARWELSGALWDLGRCDEAIQVLRTAVGEAEQSDQLGVALEAAAELAATHFSGREQTEDALLLARRTQCRRTAGRPPPFRGLRRRARGRMARPGRRVRCRRSAVRGLLPPREADISRLLVPRPAPARTGRGRLGGGPRGGHRREAPARARH